MHRVSLVTVVLIVTSIGAQLLGISLLPQTAGLTRPVTTAVCAAAFAVGIGALARLSYRGIELGILIPIMAAVVPLATIFVGILIYGESASLLKLALLLGACGAIGWASALS